MFGSASRLLLRPDGARRSPALVAWAAAAVLSLGLPLVLASPASALGGTTLVTLSGVYTEVHGDSRYADQTLHFLDVLGVHYALVTAGEPDVPPGAPATVVAAPGSGNTLDTTAPGGGITQTGPAPAAPAATGSQSVLVINVAWAGASLTATTAQEQSFMFGSDPRSLAHYYSDTSYGQMTWTGTQTPTYTILPPSGCDLYGLSDRAEAAATAGGYRPSSYRALMVNAPDLFCGANGYGEIGGPHTWIKDGLWNLADGYAREVPTHEIGHSLGLFHSHGLECGSVTVSSACLGDPASHNEEYGNAWDVMGNNWPGDGHDSVTWFSARQEMLLGWLSGSHVRTVSASGTYALAPLEKSGATSPQVLVLPTAAHTYYVEYRQPIGQDAFLSAYPAATKSIQVSVAAASGNDTGPYALDFTPQSDTSGGYNDWIDAPLGMGRSFGDPEGTFTIAPVSQDGTSATVNVSFVGASTYPLSVSRSGTGSGTVTSSPGGIVCGSTCTAGFSAGTPVKLTPAAATGSVFSGWAGACSGTSSCTAAMTATRTVTANFTKKYEESAASLDGWAPHSDTTGSYRSTAVAGSTAQLSFTGTGVTWLTRRGPAQGKASVTVDGVSKGTIDLYAASAQSYAAPITGLTPSAHTLVVKALGTKNAAASAATVAVDGFTVGTTTTQDSSVNVLYDSWKGMASSSASGGSYRVTGTAGRTATVSFTGTGVDWVTSTGPGSGKAEVFIDGVDKGSVDLYASSTHYQSVRDYSGLTAGAHTIVVKVLGQKNASATATTVAVDAFLVH